MTAFDTRLALLQALAAGDNYGLGLIDAVHKTTRGRLRIVQGRVYPVLRRLEDEGLIKSYDGKPRAERGGRPRRYYRLTKAGLREAKADARAVYRLLQPALGTES